MKTILTFSVRSVVVATGLVFAGAGHAALVLPGVETCGAAIQTALSGGLNNLQCLQAR
jgi:hypothetical protein